MNELELIEKILNPSQKEMNFLQWLGNETGNQNFVILLAIIIGITINAVTRKIVRGRNIAKNGWPPPHCDADGDIIDVEDINKKDV